MPNTATLAYNEDLERFEATGNPGAADVSANSAKLNHLPMNGMAGDAGEPAKFTYNHEAPVPDGEYVAVVYFSDGRSAESNPVDFP